MGLSCGIIGLPNVGKSTLFNALSQQQIAAQNYPFCTIEPNEGMIMVPDERLDQLSALVKPQRSIPTKLRIVDVAGLVRGAHKGEGLGNRFLAHLREVDVLIHILRCFEDAAILHVDGKVQPLEDKAIVDMELQLKDIDTLTQGLAKRKKIAASGDKNAQELCKVLERCHACLEKGQSLRTLSWERSAQHLLKEISLLSIKPVIYVANIAEKELPVDNPWLSVLAPLLHKEGSQHIVLSAALEHQLSSLTEADKQSFLEDYGLKEPGLYPLIRAGYQALGLITYFTVGPQEVRAWTVPRGCKAPAAGGVIHDDFERGFIRAEVIKYKDFVHHQSERACKDAGVMTVEGKEYVMEDGDIVHFRFHV